MAAPTFLAPGLTVEAAWLGLRNDLQVPVVVQSSSVLNNNVRRGKPRLLYPGEVAWDGILQSGVKLIEVYDAKGRQLLYREQIRCAGDDQFYSLRSDRAARKPVTLAPAKMPANTPGGRMTR